MQRPGPDAVLDVLAGREPGEVGPLPGRTNHLRAGILVPLRWTGDGIETLLTLRPATLRRHAGEVSFPGAGPKDQDVDLQATALREAHEEIGLSEARVLGRLSSMPLYTSDWRLEPFVAEVPATAALVADPVEVERVLPLDLWPFIAEGTVEAVSQMAQGWQMPIFRPEGHLVYGATALTLLEAIGVLAEAAGLEAPTLRDGDCAWEQVLALARAAAGS